MLISEDYRQLNRAMHLARPNYGASGAAHATSLLALVAETGAESVLDYGCGKGGLKATLRHRLDVREYDPAIPGKDAPPGPADLVVCMDVLEHIEPECLDAVLDHIASLARIGVVLSVCMVRAVKLLPDGRNAHLIVEGRDWWWPKLASRWDESRHMSLSDHFVFIGKTKQKEQVAA